MNRKAELGFSTLVLITAIILVSAVVFYAFTSSASHVGQEAKSTGLQVRDNVGTAMNIIKLYAEDGSSGNSVDYFYFEIKPPYASQEIKLNDTLLLMSLDNASGEYSYNSSINCSTSTDIERAENSGKFGITYVDGSASYSDAIVGGELVRLCWKSPRSVEKDDSIKIRFFSTVGYGATIDTSYTKIINSKLIYFFP